MRRQGGNIRSGVPAILGSFHFTCSILAKFSAAFMAAATDHSKIGHPFSVRLIVPRVDRTAALGTYELPSLKTVIVRVKDIVPHIWNAVHSLDSTTSQQTSWQRRSESPPCLVPVQQTQMDTHRFHGHVARREELESLLCWHCLHHLSRWASFWNSLS